MAGSIKIFSKKLCWFFGAVAIAAIGNALGTRLAGVPFLKSLDAIWGVLTYLVPTPLAVLLVLGLFTFLYFAKLRKDGLASRHSQPWSITEKPIDGILWEYTICLTTEDEEVEFGKPICPTAQCKNELDMRPYNSISSDRTQPRGFGTKAICNNCLFSNDFPSYHLRGIEILAKQEIERRRRVGEKV